MAIETAPARRTLAHIHLGEDGGAERFFVRLSGALAGHGVKQVAFVRPGRPWREDLARHCDVREVRFSRSHIKRHLIRWHIARQIRAFGATTTLGWMSPASKWMPKPGAEMKTFLRLGDFPDTFRTYGNVERLIGNTPEIIRQAGEMGWPQDRAHMISNFVAPMSADIAPARRTDHNTPEDATVVIALGRFVDRKRFDLVIRAIGTLFGVHVWLIGDGPLKPDLEALAATLSVSDRVHFLGWQRDPAPFLKAANILACPSDDEPLGNVVLEGWNTGLPVVATASQGPSWLIEDGKTGLLSPCGDPDELAASIKRIVDGPALRETLVAAGHAQMCDRFSEDAVSQAYMDLLFGAHA